MRGEAAPRRKTASSACRRRMTLAGFTLTAPSSPLISRPVNADAAEAVSSERTGSPRASSARVTSSLLEVTATGSPPTMAKLST
eukprot:2171014-Pyramimonas_sp.AAC.1